MKYSLQMKLTGILIAIVGCVIFGTWFLNYALGEQYYEASEAKKAINTYKKLDEFLEKRETLLEERSSQEEEESSSQKEEEENASQKGKEKSSSSKKKKDVFRVKNESLEKVENEIIELLYQPSMYIMVTGLNDYNLGQEILFTNCTSDSGKYNELCFLLNGIMTNILLRSNYNGFLPESFFDNTDVFDTDDDYISTMINDGYYLTTNKGSRKGNSGIYLFGYTKTHNLVGITVPLESIKSSAAISSRFFAYVGCVAVIIGAIAILIATSRFTRPIKEMAGIADKMAQLDFDAKIKINTKDELELLGNSMNTLSETLESTIADLKAANLELQKDIEKKEEIDEMRKEFLSHVSHELKTPIALIQGYAEGLSENIMEDEESREFYCEVISDEARKMNLMVQKLLTLNQIEFGNTQLDMQRFDICQLISNKIQASQILIKKNQNQVIFEEETPVHVWADEFMIEEVFSNYFSNALHHVNPGGIIRIWIERLGQNVRIHVFNEGKPIPEEDLEKLWIKFYKVDKARTREYGGSGIGLSIVAATMNAHGKDFGVNNVENGVDFYFDLELDSGCAKGE